MYKVHLQGYAIQASFDWDTMTIGPYHVDSEYKYSNEFHVSVAEPSKHWLYKCMFDDPTVIACFFVNATYVCCLKSNGRYYYYDIEQRLILHPKNFWDGYLDDCVLVGYQKTRYNCQSTYTPVAGVIYSPKRRAINVSGRWIPVNDEIETDISEFKFMYSELIHSEFEYYYFKKGGDIVWKDF